jgi:hypothetical protein
MKADGSLKTLLQGVSQQPTRDRLPGQATEQINMNSDPVDGLTRRPPTDLVGSLGDLPEANLRGWYKTLTPDGQKVIIKISNTGVRVFDYNANEFTVNVVGDQSAYFGTAGVWSATSITGDTYLANNGVSVRMGSAVKSYWNTGAVTRPQGIIQILGGAYGKMYSVYKDGVLQCRFRTPDGSSTDHAREVGTTYISQVLAWLLVADPDDPVPVQFGSTGGALYMRLIPGGAMPSADWDVVRQDDVIYIRHTAGFTQFDLTVADDAGNLNAKAMTLTVPDIADLPRYAPHNYVVRVAQETDPEEDLWLRFVSDDTTTDGSGFGTSGAWYEAVAPELVYRFNEATMPRQLSFNTTTQEFTLSASVWEDRAVGTDVTNPLPSFVDRPIEDMAVFQSRLSFLAGTSWIASRSKKYTNFWIGSASTLTDADPIDITSQAAFATLLRHALPHNKDMVLFSDSGQFVIFGRTALTPTNAALVLTTSFEADLTAKPVPSGRNVFFATRFGRYTGVREFYTEGGTDINDTRPVTQHVKKYIIGGPVHLSSTSNFDHLLVHTDTERTTVYPYQFIWSDSAKVQSAWHKWKFFGEVIHSFFDSELVYLIMQIGNTQYLLRMSLDVNAEEGVGYPMFADAKFDVAGVNNAFLLPYDFFSVEDLIIVQGDGCPYPGMKNRIESVVDSADGWVVTMREDVEGGDIVVGVNYRDNSMYEPTMPRMKDQDGVVMSTARLMINQFIVSCSQTGRIAGQKHTQWGVSEPVIYQGYSVNNADAIVGQPGISDIEFKMPFKERADRGTVRFYSEDHWPMTMLDIEWKGTINKRGKRIPTGE